MESIYTELALYGSKNGCARTDTGFLPIYEVSDGTVSLTRVIVEQPHCTRSVKYVKKNTRP